MNEIANEYLYGVDPQYREIAERVISVIESIDPSFTMAVKWKQLTFALNGDFHHWICAIALTKKSVNLLFHFGGLLDDTNNVLKSGASKFLRKIEFCTLSDIDEQIISNLVSQAIDKLPYFIDNWKELNKK
ncbi:MAG TPA: DUF1801 domain-containing protein [Armatimonadota bacterium]|jgi:hypothetical protein|nr:DUF1801 domain-containing protein [Armatimonadota bacterium]HOM72140.1 DUF1801 domain-containing protein [Armatimonadota bacterium]